MKKLFTFLTMLLLGIGSMWGDVLPGATVGTTAFQATALTTGASGHTITKDGDGNVTISPVSGFFGNNTNEFTGTLVIKINIPETPEAGVIFEFRTASKVTNTGSQGLHLSADRILATSWTGNRRSDSNITYPASGVTNRTLTAGEHTIIFLAGSNGGYAVVDNLTYIYIRDAGLKKSNVEYKAIYIPKAYAQYITEVHYFTDSKSDANKTTIFTECGNHMHASQQSSTTASVASGKTLILDKAVSWTSLTGTGTVLQEVNINTTVAGNLPALTLKATAGTLTYTGSNLNGTTLDGVILGGSERITTSNTVTIKNLAGNNLSNTNNNYAFVGSGNSILNFYGTCDLTKRSDGTDCNSSKLGYGKTSSINIKSGANVTTAEIYNTQTSDNNAMISIESGATLNATAEMRSISAMNQGTINGTNIVGPITLYDGSTTTLTNATPFGGAVTVSGDATLNLTASNVTLNQAITINSGKTLTIDGSTGSTNNAEISLPNSLTNNGTIHFKDAILNFTERDLSALSYTFDNCTLQFAETGDEYKNGGFTITNIPSGVTVKVKQYDGDAYETVTPEAGTATISHEVGVSGYAAWLDYTFNESTKSTNIHSPADQQITNAGNAGSGNNLKIDGSYTTATSYNDDGTLKVMSTPWRDITWPTNYTVAVAGNVPDVENGCLVAFGSSTNGSKNYLAIIRGASQNEIKLVKGHTISNQFEVISTMSAANATALSHLVVFTKNGNTFTVYLDGVQKTQVTYSETLGGGFQIGSVHGGVSDNTGSTGIVRVDAMDATAKAKVFAKTIRVYDYVVSDDQMSQLTKEFPYVSFGGTYSRTISENSNLSATDAWLNAGTQGYVDVPVNAVVDEVTYYPDVEITTTTASTLTVNANMDTENIKFDGTGKLTIASDGTHNINIYGSITANGPVSVKYGEIDLTAVPVSIGESGSVEFDFSASDFSGVTTSTDYPITGNTSDYGNKVTGVYPSDIYHTFTITHNSTTNSYYLTVGPSVALKQKQAIDLVTPYYNGQHVGSGLGKYIISLGETSYSNFVDFSTAVTSWQTLGDCVEPTIVMNMPTNGFYRIQSQNNGDNKGNVGKYLHNNLYNGGLALNTNNDMTSIFYIDRTNNAILSYADGKYLNYWDQAPTVGNSGTWTIMEGSEIGKYAIKIGSSNWYASDWNTTDHITNGNKDANALWAIEPVTSLPFEIEANSYKSFSAPVAITIPGNCKAYIAKTKNNNTIKMEEVTGNVPANTGLVIGSGEATNLSFDIYTGNDLAVCSGDLLECNIAAAELSRNDNYFFGKQKSTGNYIFTKLSGTGDNYTLYGFKSYLPAAKLPDAVDARIAVVWDYDDPTGLNELKDDSMEVKDGKYYQNQKIVVIRNGVKYNVAGQIIK